MKQGKKKGKGKEKKREEIEPFRFAALEQIRSDQNGTEQDPENSE